MNINQKKLARQNQIIDKWFANGCKGTLEAVTGFGKTYVLILIIKRFHVKYPGHQVDIVVPKLNLWEDWTDPYRGHIEIHGLKWVNVFVVNTYIKFERRFPAILGLDEVHNYASEEFGKVFEIAGIKPVKESIAEPPFVLGLTATLERNDGKQSFIEEYCPVIDTVTLEEAKREGYISKFKTYNLGLEFNEEDQEQYNIYDNTFRNAFAKFNHHFHLAMACSKAAAVYTKLTVPVKSRELVNGVPVLIEKEIESIKNSGEWQMYFAQYNEWDGTPDHEWSPKNVSKIAQQFSSSMRNRKLMIYKASVKIDAIEEIVNKFPTLKTISFSEDTDFADKVVERLGEERCRSYHSKTKGTVIREEKLDKKGKLIYKDKKIGAAKHKAAIKEDFVNGLFQVFSTVKSIDEGFDDPTVVIGVQASYTSTKRQDIQRNGRNTRKDELNADKMALTVNLYMKNSQEEKWLRDKQRGVRDVEWIDSVEEINFEESMEGNFSLTD